MDQGEGKRKRRFIGGVDEKRGRMVILSIFLKGKLGKFLYWPKVFIGPKLREVSKGNFCRKAPKLVKHQVEGTKIDQIRTKGPTATVGIHSIQVNSYCKNPPTRSSYSSC